MNSIVLRPNEKPKQVKDLGWLLRHWQKVESFGFNYSPDSRNMCDGELVARLRGGTVYMTGFASLSVCWNWLDRPIFRSLKFKLVFNNFQSEKFFTIGDAEWKRINKLEYKDFFKELELTIQ
jgi:hypothetical protein